MSKQFIVCVFIIANVAITFENKLKSSELFKDYLYLKKMFNNELTRMLPEQDYKNYVINLVENKKSLYMSLYNLF